MLLATDDATGFIRVDWFTQDGLPIWGDGRLFILGTEGTIELRKYIDIAGRAGSGSSLPGRPQGRPAHRLRQDEDHLRRAASRRCARTAPKPRCRRRHCFYATELALDCSGESEAARRKAAAGSAPHDPTLKRRRGRGRRRRQPHRRLSRARRALFGRGALRHRRASAQATSRPSTASRRSSPNSTPCLASGSTSSISARPPRCISRRRGRRSSPATTSWSKSRSRALSRRPMRSRSWSSSRASAFRRSSSTASRTASRKLLHLRRKGFVGKAYAATVETHWRRLPSYYANPWRGRWATELGGCFTTHAIHNHDILTYILGPVAERLCRSVTRVNPIETEDCGAAVLEMADGSFATLSVTLGAEEDMSRLRFCFEGLTVESNHSPYNPGTTPWRFIAADPDRQSEIDAAVAEVPLGPERNAGQFLRLHKALTEGAPLPVSIADARASIELLTAAYHSARTGEAVRLPLGRDHPLYRWLAASDGEGGRLMASLDLRGVVKRFGSVEVIHGLDLHIEDGEFIVFVGPSGCGKSTLLRMIAGLEEVTAGEIWHRRRAGERRARGQARPRDGVPVLRALPAHVGAEESFIRSRDAQDAERPRSSAASPMPRRSCRSKSCSTAGRDSFPAASASASRSGARSCASRRSSSSTSRFPTSTRSCACRCGSRSRSCTGDSA